jgi:hypothetical protein
MTELDQMAEEYANSKYEAQGDIVNQMHWSDCYDGFKSGFNRCEEKMAAEMDELREKHGRQSKTIAELHEHLALILGLKPPVDVLEPFKRAKQITEKLEAYEKALKFYADKGNYSVTEVIKSLGSNIPISHVNKDKGEISRQALGVKDEQG